MAFTPRRLEDGRICCSRAEALCKTCEAHFRRESLGLRTNQAVPDPYATALQDTSVEVTPFMDPRYAESKGRIPPDGYAIGLALRAAREAEQ
ncbi:MAG TPA: hypothetical protein VI485_23110 [Vicinamibacterales bacterium]|nr:hypothetical protein [Vicinamibacterales bacterium]